MRGKFKIAIACAIISVLLLILTLMCVFPPDWIIAMIREKITNTTSSGTGKIGAFFGKIIGQTTVENLLPLLLKKYAWYCGILSATFMLIAETFFWMGYKNRKKEQIST